MRILIAEDERDLNSILTKKLTADGYSVDACFDGEEALHCLSVAEYDAVILDVMMPKMNGVEVLKKLRKEGIRTPVMMLTAKAATGDRITGFDAGADDYLPKPFEPDELISRVRAMLRRSGDYKPNILTFGDLSLDPDSGTLSCGEKSVRLSGREFQVMELLMSDPSRVHRQERIFGRVWGLDSDSEINVVWVYMSYLRKKLAALGANVTIRLNRGVGYVIEVDDRNDKKD